jgi:hypothetical protein
MENKQTKIIKFQDVSKAIVAELESRGQEIGVTEPVTLVDGFISQPFSMELSNSFVIGGPTIPMIMLLGNKSGQIYFFALKAILKNMEL